jgi:hypothetical protein
VGTGHGAILLQALTGVRPGDAVADLVFVLLFHMFLSKLLGALGQHGLLECRRLPVLLIVVQL